MSTTENTETEEIEESPVEDLGNGSRASDPLPEESEESEIEESETDEEVNPSRREAKYRRQLRDVEAERDALVGRVETLQRAEAERIAGEVLDKPIGLWAGEVTLADLLDADGNIDRDAVLTAAQTARNDLGLAPKPSGMYMPGVGSGSTRSAAVPSFADSFGPGR